MAREVVRRLGLRSLRIRVEDVGTLDNNSILQALLILKPDVVILDDFDRNSSQSHLFEALENLQKNVKIVLATVNERNRLDEALLRPGRFDEMICVDRLDEEVVRLVLGPDCQDSFEQVKDWPIAFINEFAKRRLFLSPTEAKSSMDELIKRVARVRAKHTTDDLEERFLDAAAGNLDDSPKEE
jgi:glycerol-3-phosphate cytidylyltransferase-like family protein